MPHPISRRNRPVGPSGERGGRGLFAQSTESRGGLTVAFRSVLRHASSTTGQVPAMAFFHICLPEYNELIAAKVPISGQQQEACGSASVDSGLFTAFVETGDVKVATVGHDHKNDYCGAWHGVELCYGKGEGWGWMVRWVVRWMVRWMVRWHGVELCYGKPRGPELAGCTCTCIRAACRIMLAPNQTGYVFWRWGWGRGSLHHRCPSGTD